MIGAVFDNRDFSARTQKNWDNLVVERYSKSVIGGPRRAHIIATGNEKELWEFVEMLRCPTRIIDYSRAKPVWWGFIGKVTIYTKSGLRFGVSIDTMANKLAIAYTYNKERATTVWDSDTDSQNEFGIKELLLAAYEKTADQVTQFQDSELEARKYPGRLPLYFGNPRQQAEARIECYGWWDTLAWRYYSELKGRVAYEEEDTWYGREVGEDNRPIIAQSFQQTSGSSWDASTIWLKCRKKGSPTDNLLVDLYSDSGGDPDVLLRGTDDVAGADLTEYLVWTEFTLDSAYTLADSTKYWIRIARSGAVDSDNFYSIGGTSSDGYADGEMKLYDGSSWATWGNTPDLNFRVLGENETTTQISDCITAVGEFIEGTDIEDTSGVDSSPYRDGDATAMYEIEQLLKVGTANNRRLLAEITPQRRLRVYEEPAAWSADYHIDGFGRITDENDTVIQVADCPVGYWGRLKGVIPDTVDSSRLVNASQLFVEMAEYNVSKDRYIILKSRDATSPFEFLTIQDG